MQRQSLRKAVDLARQAATTGAEAAGSWAPRRAIHEVAGGLAVWQAPLRHCQQGTFTTAAGAAAAAPPSSQPWLCVGVHRGLNTWAKQHRHYQGAAGAALLKPGHGMQQQQPPPPQQQPGQARAASAQAMPVEAAAAPTSSQEGLAISDSAVGRLRELQAESSAPVTLRITVEGGGCSGFQYEFAMEEGDPSQPLAESDRLFERDGVRVVCDDISLEFLKGATVDFESDLMRSAFVIQDNPNAASSCGCGSSFVAK